MRAWRRLAHAHAHALVLLACCALALGAHAAHLDLAIELEPESRRLSAAAEFVAPPDFSFALHPALTVQRATIDGKPATVSASSHRGLRRWRIPDSDGARVRIEYGGTLPALDTTLDHRAVLRSQPPRAAASGSFLPAGADWYPSPARVFSYTVRVSVPAGQRALVPGRLVEETSGDDADGRYVARFEFAHPSEGIDLIAGPYSVREKLVTREGREPLRLRTYFYRDLDALAQGYLEDSGRYIEFYSREIGAYPFDAFSIVASPLPTGFGMPGLTYIGARVLKLPFILATSLRHEVLHNWWGNGVYVDYASGNWSEGLTTFMADYAYRESRSAQAAREIRLSWLRDAAAVPRGRAIALAAFRSRTHGAEAAAGYGKAAMVFFMLRDEIGVEAYRSGLQRFWQARRFRTSSWRDLRAAFEATSGRSLAIYFTQWVERVGAPTVEVREARSRVSPGKFELVMSLEQSAPAYALAVPIAIEGAEKSETRHVISSKRSETLTLPLDFEPQRVRVDPDLRVWRTLSPGELPPILRQWIVARAPRVLIAAREPAAHRAAGSVAEALLEQKPRPATTPGPTGDPLLVIGLHHEIDATLARLELPPRPPALGTIIGSAQVWTVEHATRAPVAVVSARDTEALQALVRPLPHYGAQSFLVFEGARVIARGIWPGASPVVPVVRER